MSCDPSLLPYVLFEAILAFQDTHFKIRLDSANARMYFTGRKPSELRKPLRGYTLTEGKLA